VFWVKADSIESLEFGYRAIASKINPEFRPDTQDSLFSMVKDHLEEHDSRPWLLVLDDVEDRKLLERDLGGSKSFILNYIPWASQGQVLITSRDPTIAGQADGRIVPAANGLRIEPMCTHDCETLFRKGIRSDVDWGASSAQQTELWNLLGGLPLAIVQAASYIREEHSTIGEFIKEYRNFKLNDLFRRNAIGIDKKQESVLFTWGISYRKIAGPSSSDAKSNAARLLDLLGFIDSQSSPLRTMSEAEFEFKDHIGESPIHGIDFSCGRQEPPSAFLRSIFDNRFTPASDQQFRRALSSLQNYSLIASRECWVHPVVHSWISHQLTLEEKCEYIEWISEELQRDILNPGNYIEDGWDDFLLPPTTNSLSMSGVLTPLRHTRILLTYAQSKPIMEYMTGHKKTALEFAEVLYRIGLITAQMGKSKDGVGHLEKAIAIMADNVEETLMWERRIKLAKTRSRIVSPRAALDEAERCYDLGRVPSVQATLWLAQCLHNGGHLIQALHHFESVREMFSMHSEPNFESHKELLAASIGAVQVLSDMRQPQNNIKIREIIDTSLTPLFNSMPLAHMLRTILLPKILIDRIEAAKDPVDQSLAIRNLVQYYRSDLGDLGTGGQPQEWLLLIEQLQQRKKWDIIKELANTFIESHRSIQHHLELIANHNYQQRDLNIILDQIDAWDRIYNCLAQACLAVGDLEGAEKAHWVALGRCWFSLRDDANSKRYQEHLQALCDALSKQGETKDKVLQVLKRQLEIAIIRGENEVRDS